MVFLRWICFLFFRIEGEEKIEMMVGWKRKGEEKRGISKGKASMTSFLTPPSIYYWQSQPPAQREGAPVGPGQGRAELLTRRGLVGIIAVRESASGCKYQSRTEGWCCWRETRSLLLAWLRTWFGTGTGTLERTGVLVHPIPCQ